MKKQLIVLVLTVLLVFTGCLPVDDRISEQNMELNLGTTPENIANGYGYFAMSNGLVYIAEGSVDDVLEFDIESRKTVKIPMPEGEKISPLSDSLQFGYRPTGSLFLLSSGIGLVEKSSVQRKYLDDDGKIWWLISDVQTLSILEYDGVRSTPVPELGNYVYRVLPMEKQQVPETVDKDNPLAGLDLYYFFGYDTFPETAAQLKQDGIILEEPIDPAERSQYIIPALGHMDGDTQKTRVLTRTFLGEFFVDEQYIYIIQTNSQGENSLLRSSRSEIDFQPIDLGGDIGAYIAPYDGGFYFWRSGSWQICWYKDGKITELPITGGSFIRWKNQLIYQDNHWQDGTKYDPIKSYNLETGEVRTLCENTAFPFCILGDKYLACIQYLEKSKSYILVDLDTGEQMEMYRIGDTPIDRPDEAQKALEEEKSRIEEEQEGFS